MNPNDDSNQASDGNQLNDPSVDETGFNETVLENSAGSESKPTKSSYLQPEEQVQSYDQSATLPPNEYPSQTVEPISDEFGLATKLGVDNQQSQEPFPSQNYFNQPSTSNTQPVPQPELQPVPQPVPQPIPQPIPQVVPQSEQQVLQDPIKKSGARVSRMLLVIALLSILAMLITAAFYLYNQQSSKSENIPAQDLVEPTNVPEEIGEAVEFPSTKLINIVTILIAEDVYTMNYEGTSATNTGCSFDGSIVARKSLEDYYSKVISNYSSTEAESICTSESKLSLFFETYKVGDMFYTKQRETVDFVVVADETSMAMAYSPSEAVYEFLPFPTLLTVVSARKMPDATTVINAKVDESSLTGTYIFTLNNVDRIISIEHELMSLVDESTTSAKGKAQIVYSADQIVAPQITKDTI